MSRGAGLFVAAAVAAGCGGATESIPVVSASTDAANASPEVATVALPTPNKALGRLTVTQYRNSVRDLLGTDITLPATLDTDLPADGLDAVGASVTAISPRGVELYEDAARSLGQQAVATPERLAALFPCTPTAADDPCFETATRAVGRRAFRRPLEPEEVTRFTGLAKKAGAALTSPTQGLAWLVTALLQSPGFLYREERGSGGLLDAYSFATRLSLFLWSSAPDPALLAAAESGSLDSPAGLAQEVDRLLASPRLRDATRAFFTDWWRLRDLDRLAKDPAVFKHYSPDLGGMAREETLRLVEHVVFDRDADFGELFTTRTTFVNRRLAALYNVPAATEEGFGKIELPADEPRRGVLGHASFLGMYSHPTSSSATQRGVFIRETLQCQFVPPPPSNLNTSIPEPTEKAKTLKERLVVHMEDPSCSGCHAFTDPVGWGFESFDGIGRFRLTEHDAVIDPSGEVDGTPYADFQGLVTLLSTDPLVTRCHVQKLWSYAVGHPLDAAEGKVVDRLTEAFTSKGRRTRALLRLIALDPAFRRVGEVAP